MHSHSRKTLLGQLLVLQPGREVTRDVVEAAIWQTVGWEADPRYVGRLLSVIDAFVDARVKRVVAHTTGIPQPQYATSLAMPDQAAAEALAGISRSGIARPASTVIRAVPPAEPPKPVSHPAITPEEPEDPDEFLRRAFEASGGVVPFPDDDDDDGLDDYISGNGNGDGTVTVLDGLPLRTCTRCKNDLPLVEFWKNKRGPGGYEWQCRDCKSKKAPSRKTA